MQKRVLSFIDRAAHEAVSDAEFDAQAREVFCYQYETVPAYRGFCEARGRAPGSVTCWREIPAMPADGFKEGLFEREARPHVFLSSGTTGGPDRRSRHELGSLETYEIAAKTHFHAMVLPDDPGPMAVLVLGPTAATHPSSSLGQMFTWCAEAYGEGAAAVAFDDEGGVNLDLATDWLHRLTDDGRPVLVLAVSSALTALLEHLRVSGLRLRLPADSRLVDTGGDKGGRTLSANGLRKAAWSRLHIPGYNCINEYGMTEMLSQFYDDALLSRYSGNSRPRAKVGPPWVRTAILDPASLEPVAAGEPGILCHLDLANWESIAAIQTLDVGRAAGAGFELLGRAPEAESRGCSQLMAFVRGTPATHADEEDHLE